MGRPIFSAFAGAATGLVLILAALASSAPGGGGASSSLGLDSYPCSHVGGGVWQETWNNSSRTGPTHVWVPEPGHWWLAYNNSTGAAGNPGWGSLGTSTPDNSPGWTFVNVTNLSLPVEAMMQSLCVDGSSSLPWHYDFASQQFVRDP